MGDTIASFYAMRAGGDEPLWRARMRAESWFRAQEAVDIGLADGVVGGKAQNRAGIFNLAQFKNVPDWVPQAVEDVAIAPHSTAKAPEDTPWNGSPNLQDFTAEQWDALSDSEKSRIAEHFIWSDSGMPPAIFSDLKGGHHEVSASGVGAVVWRAVSSGRMAQLTEYENPGVRAHLARHYDQFGKTPPWAEATNEINPDLEALRDGVREVVGKPGETAFKTASMLSALREGIEEVVKH
jgi:hypothetical protein